MKNITIYTGPMCNYCEAAKRLLTRNNATYNEINIATVDGAMDEMIKKANGNQSTHAAHQNTPDARSMMGRYRSQVPAKLRRFT